MDTRAVDSQVERFERALAGALDSAVVLRVGLAALIFLAGAHKVVAPDVWGAYTAPLVESLWPVDTNVTMVLFGLSEVAFGLVLFADLYTSVVAAVTALSILAVVADLALGAVQTGQHVDVLVRDLGLFVLAAGVAVQAAERGGAGRDE